MPESKSDALARAKKHGFTESSVMKGEKGYYIIPHGITDPDAKQAYLHSRDSGDRPEISAKIAHTVQNKKTLSKEHL